MKKPKNGLGGFFFIKTGLSPAVVSEWGGGWGTAHKASLDQIFLWPNDRFHIDWTSTLFTLFRFPYETGSHYPSFFFKFYFDKIVFQSRPQHIVHFNRLFILSVFTLSGLHRNIHVLTTGYRAAIKLYFFLQK